MTEKINVFYVIENNKVVWGGEQIINCGHCVHNFIIDGEERNPNIRKQYSSYEAEAFNYSKDWNVSKFFIEFFITEGLTSIGERYCDSTREFIQLSKDGILINNIGELVIYHGNNTTIKELYNLYKNEGLNDCVKNQYEGYRWGARIDLNNRTFEIFNVWSALNKDDSKIRGSFNEDGHITDYKWEA